MQNMLSQEKRHALARDFQPGPFDVICGRGKACYRHEGNLNMRRIVAALVEEYSKAITKDDKSRIVAQVLAQVRAHGGFVKQDHGGGWYDVGNIHAREKISQAFRDLLHDQYRSSLDTRRKIRQAKRKEIMEDSSTSTRMEETSDTDVNYEDDEVKKEVATRSDPPQQQNETAPAAEDMKPQADPMVGQNDDQNDANPDLQHVPRLSLILAFDEDFREFSKE